MGRLKWQCTIDDWSRHDTDGRAAALRGHAHHDRCRTGRYLRRETPETSGRVHSRAGRCRCHRTGRAREPQQVDGTPAADRARQLRPRPPGRRPLLPVRPAIRDRQSGLAGRRIGPAAPGHAIPGRSVCRDPARGPPSGPVRDPGSVCRKAVRSLIGPVPYCRRDLPPGLCDCAR
jgi:hypothetical protein